MQFSPEFLTNFNRWCHKCLHNQKAFLSITELTSGRSIPPHSAKSFHPQINIIVFNTTILKLWLVSYDLVALAAGSFHCDNLSWSGKVILDLIFSFHILRILVGFILIKFLLFLLNCHMSHELASHIHVILYVKRLVKDVSLNLNVVRMFVFVVCAHYLQILVIVAFLLILPRNVYEKKSIYIILPHLGLLYK